MANRFPLIFNSGAGQIQELAASDNLDLTSSNLVNAGILFTSSGSQTAPSLQIGSGTTYNPGLYSPGTDQVAVATNGTGRLFIDASGNVGINTVSAIAPGGYGYAREFAFTGATSGDSSVGFNMRGSRTVAGGFADINFWHQSTANRAYIQARRGSSDSAIDLDFITSGGAGMRITSAGLVGIGTSSPNYELHVNASDATNFIQLTNSGTGTGASDGFLLYNNGVNATVSNQEAGYLSLETSGQARLHILSDGKVGIGTTPAAGSLLHINSAASTDCKQQISVTTGTQAAYTAYVNTTVSTVGTENSTGGSLMSGSGPYATVISNGGAYPINFGTNNTIRATIDSSGRLLVGTSSARSLFFAGGASALTQIEGNSTGTASLSITRNDATADGNALILAKARSTSYAVLQYVNGTTSDDRIGRISFQGADGTNMVPAANIEAFVDSTPGANDMPGRLVFSTTADGASSPTEHVRINQAGALKVSSNGTYGSASSPVNEFYQSTNSVGLNSRCVNASFTDSVLTLDADRNTTNNTYYFTRFSCTGVAYRFQVADSGNVTNTNNSYGAISDVKLKENIADASSQWNDLKALQVRKYNFKEETGQPTHTQIGLIAQEVELVSPGLVTESPDRDEEGNDLGTVTKSVNYSVLYMKAVKALQEAMERIETLEASNADLLARVSALESA